MGSGDVWAADHSHIRENTVPLLLDQSFGKMVSGAILGIWYQSRTMVRYPAVTLGGGIDGLCHVTGTVSQETTELGAG